TYLMTFISLAVPLTLILVVSQNYNLVELMQDSPVGLVRAKAKGVADPQWLVNIGGVVHKEALEAKSAEKSATPGGAAGEGSRNLRTAADSAENNGSTGAATIAGGLAIPFYVIMLAMF